MYFLICKGCIHYIMFNNDVGIGSGISFKLGRPLTRRPSFKTHSACACVQLSRQSTCLIVGPHHSACGMCGHGVQYTLVLCSVGGFKLCYVLLVCSASDLFTSATATH